MSRIVVPIRNLNRRLPEVGRIRIGVKTARAMKAIDTFRFTSADALALEQVATMYGGEVKPWSEQKAAPGQYEVITQANEIRVVLPADCLGGSPIYELWTGGGCERRCDGVTCTRLVKGPDGPEPVETPCACVVEGAMACDPHTRLSVILPDVRFGGVWRLDTKGWNAAQELPAMVELLESLQDRGLTTGVLRLEHRRSVTAGETHQYVVPVLALVDSMDALVAGHARFGAIDASPSASVAALGAGSTEGEDHDPPVVQVATHPAASASPSADLDDEVVDAEVVDDRSLADVLPVEANVAQALAIARGLGSKATCVEDVHGYELIAKVLDRLGLTEPVA